ncbi:MAG: FAD binding domain-containing protein [Thermoplasmata archaeon]|nr:FAD binding domain-containing protein [Thermoplasmata archaeon]
MAFTVVAPDLPEEACRLLADPARADVWAIAGGTDLLLDVDDDRCHPSLLVSLRKLPWRFLRWEGRSLTIGSTLPLSELERDPRVERELAGVFSAVRAVGSLPLRHRATLGGNLGRSAPSSDLIPVLLALDARVQLVGTSGRRLVPLAELVLGSRRTALDPGELIESVLVPESNPCAYVWQRVRPANDVSQVGVAAAASEPGSDWRIALGGVPPRAVRITAAEAELKSPSPTEAEVRRAGEAAAESAPFVTDRRATEAYRRRLVGVLVRRAVAETVAARRALPGRPSSGSERP